MKAQATWSPVVIFAGSFVSYTAPLVYAVAEAGSWYLTLGYVLFHLVPGTVVSTVALAQLAFGVSRGTAWVALAGAIVMASVPALGPIAGTVQINPAFALGALAYHLVPGAVVAGAAIVQIRSLSPTARLP